MRLPVSNCKRRIARRGDLADAERGNGTLTRTEASQFIEPALSAGLEHGYWKCQNDDSRFADRRKKHIFLAS